MPKADALILSSEENIADEEEFEDCKEEEKPGGFFRLNGWRTIILFILVLTSMLI